jgi:uridine kinase
MIIKMYLMDKIQKEIEDRHYVLVIIVGPPDSGKTTISNKLAKPFKPVRGRCEWLSERDGIERLLHLWNVRDEDVVVQFDASDTVDTDIIVAKYLSTLSDIQKTFENPTAEHKYSERLSRYAPSSEIKPVSIICIVSEAQYEEAQNIGLHAHYHIQTYGNKHMETKLCTP